MAPLFGVQSSCYRTSGHDLDVQIYLRLSLVISKPTSRKSLVTYPSGASTIVSLNSYGHYSLLSQHVGFHIDNVLANGLTSQLQVSS